MVNRKNKRQLSLASKAIETIASLENEILQPSNGNEESLALINTA